MNNITCKEVMSHICDNLGEDFDSPRCIAIKEHFETCDACKCYFRSVETTIEFYKRYNVNLTGDAHNRLISFLGLKD